MAYNIIIPELAEKITAKYYFLYVFHVVGVYGWELTRKFS